MAKETWEPWFKALPVDQQESLKDFLSDSSKELFITKPNPEDLLIGAPTYIDIHKLHELYDQLMFNTNILVKGPKGNGKTLSAISWFAKNNAPVVTVECSEDTKKTEFIGSFFLRGRETGYILGAFATAIETANETGKCALLLEELNCLTPQVQKMLNAMLDFRKSVSIPQIGKLYRLNKNAKLAVIATMNPVVYSGSYDLNEDLKSRVEEIEIGYPAHSDELRILKAVCPETSKKLPDKTLDDLIKFARETRQQATGYALSTRDLVRLVNSAAEIGLENALQLVLCKFEGDDRSLVFKRMAAIWGTVVTGKLKKYWGSLEVLT